METKTGTSTATTAWGKTLESPISYGYEWKIYTSIDEVKSANDMLTDDEIVKVRNSEKQATARQKALQAALDAAGIVKPTAENDPQVGLREMVKTLLTAKLPNGERRFTEAQAREIASTNLGVEWAE